MKWNIHKRPPVEQAAPNPVRPGTATVAPDVERRAQEIGRQLLKSAREHKAGLFSTKFWSDQLMNWAMKDPAFKIQLFRFIDVFPMLDGPQVIHDYLLDYLSDPDLSLPPGMELGLLTVR